MLNSCVTHRPTGPAPCIMAWGGIEYHSRTSLVRIAGTLNSQRYISEVLKPVVLPYIQGLATTIFNVTRIVQRFFVDPQIELISWPARSPDLSDRKHVVLGCSTIDTDYTPNFHTRLTLVTCASFLVCCTPRTHRKSL
ncbi:uncharacterized protein TNCV_2253101 [Trichonephila clavipes]|nr:uncharacterized protein TNCV_2253101 [Trichonephila clavipes]